MSMGAQAGPQQRDLAAYAVRQARGQRDMDRVFALRCERFGVGQDAYDGDCTQIMIEENGHLAAAFRLRAFADGAAMTASYAAQFYDLADFVAMKQPALELGRFCLARQVQAEVDVLRLAFAAMAARVDALGAGLLFGCASFAGVDASAHSAALGGLRAHIGQHWRIGKRARHSLDLMQFPIGTDRAAMLRGLPPLLRSYLAIGGWVGDHAVQDFDLGTIHVFTALEVAHISPPRARALRALAREMDLT